MRLDNKLAVSGLALGVSFGSSILPQEKNVRFGDGLGFESLSRLGGERLEVIADAVLLGCLFPFLTRIGATTPALLLLVSKVIALGYGSENPLRAIT
jgi:hypothetical protein